MKYEVTHKTMEQFGELKEAGRIWIEAFDSANSIDETTASTRIGEIAAENNKAAAHLEAVFRRILGLSDSVAGDPLEAE